MRILRNCIFCLKTVFRYVPGNALASVICFFVPATFTGLQVWLIQRIVDGALSYAQGTLQTAAGLEGLLLWGLILLLILLLGNSMQRVGLYQMDLVSWRLMERMTPDIAKRLTELEYASFEDPATQNIFQKMSGAPELGVYNCCLSTMFVIQRTIVLVSSMVVIFAISPWIGLGIVLIGIPMLFLGNYAAGRNMAVTSASADVRRRMSGIKELLTDRRAIYEMKIFNAERLFVRKWNTYSGQYADIALSELKKETAADIGSRLLNVTYLLFVVCMAAAGLMGGGLTLGQFTAALTAVSGIGASLNDCNRQVVWLLANAMEMDYYMDFLKLETRTDLGRVDTLPHYSIAFENVSFRYPGTRQDILKNVTFYVREGERIAFVGENGAGKSTIIKLLCGLYEPTTGSVTVGGVPVRELTPRLRTQVLSVVFQDFQTYQMTLRENVAFGNLKALEEDEKLLQALRQAGAEELAGLDCHLGRLEEEGRDLSRGEWQRVAMARAFVSDAKYVILDEPTASLDPVAESRMYENFSRIFHNRGTILISHRLASARIADRILLLDRGRIVQAGNHVDLMGKQRLYRTMFLAQSSFYGTGTEAIRDGSSGDNGSIFYGTEAEGGECSRMAGGLL